MTGAQFFLCVACTGAAVALAAVTPAYQPDTVPISWLETLAAHHCVNVSRTAGPLRSSRVVYECDDGVRVEP
jgi:hypothetical protein